MQPLLFNLGKLCGEMMWLNMCLSIAIETGKLRGKEGVFIEYVCVVGSISKQKEV